jgi:hypothetical protein
MTGNCRHHYDTHGGRGAGSLDPKSHPAPGTHRHPVGWGIVHSERRILFRACSDLDIGDPLPPLLCSGRESLLPKVISLWRSLEKHKTKPLVFSFPAAASSFATLNN